MVRTPAYERIRSSELAGERGHPDRPRREALRAPGDVVRVVMWDGTNEESTGDVTVVVETIAGVTVEFPSWFGRTSLSIKWEHFLRYEPPAR